LESDVITKIDVCARALVMMGADPISSFTDGTTESDAASHLYDDVVQNELASYPWSFSKKQEQLSRVTAAPQANYTAQYMKPADCLRLDRVTSNDWDVPFRLVGDRLFCNAGEEEVITATYTANIVPSEWPAYFLTLVEFRLAAIFSTAVAQKADIADYFERRADVQMRQAKHADASAQTNRRIKPRNVRRAR
jgi:hypothetical protein